MIKSVGRNTFIQLIDGNEIEHKYEDVEIHNGFLCLPKFNNKIEVLNHNGGDDTHSLLVAKVFAKIASLKDK